MIGPDEFRRALGHFATGVTVVTVCDGEGRPTGLTASSLASVSLDPPLVLVCVEDKAQCYATFMESDRFAINILRAEQEELSRRFASRRLEKFEGVAFTLSPFGLPLIEDALAWIECTTIHRYPGGDHTIFVGRVEHASIGFGDPLLYHRGQYRRLAGGGP